ncbi:DNA repair protein NreA [Haloarculaceae archaeon H-GB11]|nr:DNA repair protein NreA [Haloarculaceae archaeon H-GB1-1]MEA5387722.1 DNA repair protein NreA [Haloarculaceae archaeon H-GB11]
MRLDEFIEDFERDEAAERRRLAKEKSYAITDHLEDVQRQLDETLQGDALFGSTAPEIFVGRTNYPRVSTGLLSPVDHEADATEFATSGAWYQQGLGIDDVLQRRTGLLNSRRSANVDVNDVWDGFVGVQREVAIADRPVDVEVGLDGKPDFDLDADSVRTPTGPSATAERADLAENPHVPRPVEKTLEDDEWQAEGAMNYLYQRGFDVYDINNILSAGALGRGENRRLVPTRWSITAVDDTVSKFIRGGLRNQASVDEVSVWTNEYVGNRYWVVLAPGQWEFEFVEMKAPESVWNPRPEGGYYMSSAYESYEGRTGYVEETAGAYYAARLGVLEHLRDRNRQAKCLVLREITNDYWAPVGVWQVREGIRHAFEGERGVAETFHGAIRQLSPHLPVTFDRLRRKSNLVAGVQTSLGDF